MDSRQPCLIVKHVMFYLPQVLLKKLSICSVVTTYSEVFVSLRRMMSVLCPSNHLTETMITSRLQLNKSGAVVLCCRRKYWQTGRLFSVGIVSPLPPKNRKALSLIIWYLGFFPGEVDRLNINVTVHFYIAVNSTNLWLPICLPLASACCRVSATGSLAGIANTRDIFSVHTSSNVFFMFFIRFCMTRI